jgi:RHS repeat-associated protein
MPGKVYLKTQGEQEMSYEFEESFYGERVSYTSKTLDEDTGLYYFNARWYDPQIGRFLTEDPIKDGNNWYAYAGNNPIMNIDPTGLYILPTNVEANKNYDGSSFFQETSTSKNPLGNSKDGRTIQNSGCLITAIARVANVFVEKVFGNGVTMDKVKFDFRPDDFNDPKMFQKNDANFLTGNTPTYIKDKTTIKSSYEDSRDTGESVQDFISRINNSEEPYALILEIKNDSGGTHFINGESYDPDKLLVTGYDTSQQRKTSYELSVNDIVSARGVKLEEDVINVE